jgi:hypothetical protein
MQKEKWWRIVFTPNMSVDEILLAFDCHFFH